MPNNSGEVILTTKHNATSDGKSFPSTPKPQVVTETFASCSPIKQDGSDNDEELIANAEI